MYEDINGVVLGAFVDDGVEVFLSDDDRRRHLYIIGKTGTGKSTLIRSMIQSDFIRGRGFVLLDPHGDLAEQVAADTPLSRLEDVIYIDPSDPAFHLGFNPLHNIPRDQRPLVTAHVVATFSHLWNLTIDVAPRLTYFLMNSVRLLLDAPGTTLLGIPKVLVDADYRRQLLATVEDPTVRNFWQHEFVQLSERDAALAIAPILNKVGALLAPPAIRNMLGQVRPTLDIRRLMDERKILIVNLSKGKLGDATYLLGAFFASAFAQAAEGRANLPEDQRTDITLYADEFQNFATDSFTSTLSEARKWRLSLVLSHQFMAQLPTLLRQAVIGNAGSMAIFRVGGEDADVLRVDMENTELVYDQTRLVHFNIAAPLLLTDTENFHAWVRMLEDGRPTETRLVRMAWPAPSEGVGIDAVRNRTRARFLRPRILVEAKINRFLSSKAKPKKILAKQSRARMTISWPVL